MKNVELKINPWGLTAQEFTSVKLMSEGDPIKIIARKTGYSIQSIKRFLSIDYARMNQPNNVAAAVAFVKHFHICEKCSKP